MYRALGTMQARRGLSAELVRRHLAHLGHVFTVPAARMDGVPVPGDDVPFVAATADVREQAMWTIGKEHMHGGG
jgi:hypothetical protein